MIRYGYIVVLSAIVAGCAKQGSEMPSTSAASVTAAAFNATGAPTVEFSVPDMMCPDNCAVKTKEILAGQPGAKDVRVDFETKTATVAVEEEKFDADAALAALVDHGFDHSTLTSDAAAKPPAADEHAIQ